MTSLCRLLMVSMFLPLREMPWTMIKLYILCLLCPGIGLARVIQVEKMNISCCCLGKCLSGPGEKLWYPSGWMARGRPLPWLLWRGGLAWEKLRALIPWVVGHKSLQVGGRNKSMPCRAILSAWWKGDLWRQSGGRDSLSSKRKLWEASAWDPDLTRI